MAEWATVAALLASLLLLAPVTRWFSGHLHALVLLVTGNPTAAVYAVFVLLLPGTLLHELSHYLMARLLGVRTGRISLGPKTQKGGAVQFGAVEYRATDPLRESLIGLAPLVSGTIVVLGLASIPLRLDPLAAEDWRGLFAQLWQMRSAPDAAVWLYAVVAISNAMWPSATDRRSWRVVGLYLAGVVAVLALTGILAQTPTALWVGVLRLCRLLTFVYALTIVLDLLLGGLLWALGTGLGRLTNRRIIRT